MSQHQIAQTIYNWLTGPEVRGGMYSQPPYTYNSKIEPLMTGVDGMLDCNELAKALAPREAALIAALERARDYIDNCGAQAGANAAIDDIEAALASVK